MAEAGGQQLQPRTQVHVASCRVLAALLWVGEREREGAAVEGSRGLHWEARPAHVGRALAQLGRLERVPGAGWVSTKLQRLVRDGYAERLGGGDKPLYAVTARAACRPTDLSRSHSCAPQAMGRAYLAAQPPPAAAPAPPPHAAAPPEPPAHAAPPPDGAPLEVRPLSLRRCG